MTSSDDFPRDSSREPAPEPPAEPSSSGRDGDGDPFGPVDIEAAWAQIVANYGAEPDLLESDAPGPVPSGETHARGGDDAALLDGDSSQVGPTPESPESLESSPSSVESRPVVPPEWSSRPITSRRVDIPEEHFVPPIPPPLPRATPARRLAWLGLSVPPLLMLLAVIFSWSFAGWFSLLLVLGFIGGFLFLVATMPRDRPDDSDDGAVV